MLYGTNLTSRYGSGLNPSKNIVIHILAKAGESSDTGMSICDGVGHVYTRALENHQEVSPTFTHRRGSVYG